MCNPSPISSNVPIIFIFSISISSNLATINTYYNGGTAQTNIISSDAYVQFTGIELGNFSGQTMNGGISSFMIYNSVLTDAQRQQVEGYFAWKWWGSGSAILTNSSHPYYSVPIGDIGIIFNPMSFS